MLLQIEQQQAAQVAEQLLAVDLPALLASKDLLYVGSVLPYVLGELPLAEQVEACLDAFPQLVQPVLFRRQLVEDIECHQFANTRRFAIHRSGFAARNERRGEIPWLLVVASGDVEALPGVTFLIIKPRFPWIRLHVLD